MIASILAFLFKLGLSGAADKAVALLEKRLEVEGDKARIQAATTAELARAAVAEAKIMAEFNQAKLAFPWFWAFAALFLVPLGLWWNAVILDSVFSFAWNVHDLPTPQMQEWAGDMIRWVFFVGTGAGAIRYALPRK